MRDVHLKAFLSDPDWIALRAILEGGSAQSLYNACGVGGLFVFPLWQVNLPRFKIKMPLQLR
jgi:hypothetical protein